MDRCGMNESNPYQKFGFQLGKLAEVNSDDKEFLEATPNEVTSSSGGNSLRLLLEDLTEVVSFRTSSKAHIQVIDDGCDGCSGKPCLYVCPANLFILTADQSILFNYEGCFECGACAIACPTFVEWTYPTGGYGVSFRHG